MEGLYRAGSEAGAQTPPLLRASSPLKPKINRELTSKVVQQTGALQLVRDTELLNTRLFGGISYETFTNAIGSPFLVPAQSSAPPIRMVTLGMLAHSTKSFLLSNH